VGKTGCFYQKKEKGRQVTPKRASIKGKSKEEPAWRREAKKGRERLFNLVATEWGRRILSALRRKEGVGACTGYAE